MAAKVAIDMPQEKLNAFCQRNRIRKLSFFGSVVREDFGPQSDVDVLVELDPKSKPSLLDSAGMEIELTEILGRQVDLLTPGFFRPKSLARIMREAMVQYGATGRGFAPRRPHERVRSQSDSVRQRKKTATSSRTTC